MKVLIIGSGGRESAIAWKVSQSDLVNEVVVSPGNPGMKSLSDKISLHTPNESLKQYVSLKPDLVIIGPEAYLADGLTDFFDEHSIPVVGPSKAAAVIESSKVFCKEIFLEADIPTARHVVVKSMDEAASIIEKWNRTGMVVKADSLAQGKGVIVCDNKEEALEAARGFFDGSYLGRKMGTLILEEKLNGPEISAFALCDGEDFLYLGSASDYKRLLDNDEGPNTGGMGTVSPSPLLNEEDEQWIKENIFSPALRTMKIRGIPFKGFLFVGLMKTKKGFYALEFNVRMGDPETQSLFPCIESDLVPHFLKAAQGSLKESSIERKGNAVHVVLSAEGYPGVQGQLIKKGDAVKVESLSQDAFFFPAGVAEKDGVLLTNGGRICGITVVGESLKNIIPKVYSEINKVQFKGAHYRRDIGKKFV